MLQQTISLLKKREKRDSKNSDPTIKKNTNLERANLSALENENENNVILDSNIE